MSKWLKFSTLSSNAGLTIRDRKTFSLHLAIAFDPWALRISVTQLVKLLRGELNVESAVVKVSSQS